VLYEKWAGFVLSNDNPLLFCSPFPRFEKNRHGGHHGFSSREKKDFEF
jgi:hypothetical protein